MIDFVSFSLIFMISLYVPFVFSYNIDTSTGPCMYFEIFIDIWFLNELFLNFIMGYYKEGTLIMDRK